MSLSAVLERISPDQPVLIAGATASGKSGLAMEIAAAQGGVIVNADALQIYGNWRVLTARPSVGDETAFPHRLYGHVAGGDAYSVGDWLRDVEPLIARGDRPIIVGGTGLYFRALCEGLAEIPKVDNDIRADGLQQLEDLGLEHLLDAIHPKTRSMIDVQNPMRVLRAWEVERATGTPLHIWHENTPAPVLPLNKCHPIHLSSEKTWLDPRIAQRFDIMLDQGAMDEVEQNLDTWNPDSQSAQAIGAPELIAYLQGHHDLETAKELSIIATRQYAKRQRTWFRKRMRDWNFVDAAQIT